MHLPGVDESLMFRMGSTLDMDQVLEKAGHEIVSDISLGLLFKIDVLPLFLITFRESFFGIAFCEAAYIVHVSIDL